MKSQVGVGSWGVGLGVGWRAATARSSRRQHIDGGGCDGAVAPCDEGVGGWCWRIASSRP